MIMKRPAVLAIAIAFAIEVEAAQRYAAVAVPEQLPALVPRFLVDKSFPLVRRGPGSCEDGHHPCEETGHADQCCDNDSYCYVDRDGDPRCCAIGSNCDNNSPCSSDAFFCTQTVTETSGSSSSAVTQKGCCPRRCAATSQYRCAQDDGGGCCNYTAECRAGNCVATAKPSSTALLSPIEEGCTTSQYRCSDGEGCCDNDQSCTVSSGTGYCAPGRPTETGLEYIDDSSDSASLSDGAKAGIGVGAVVGAAAIIGAFTWLCIRKRRERRRATSATQPSSDHRRPDGVDVAATTDVSQTSRPPQVGHGLTQDYFGPDPIAGPYTETAGQHPVAGSASPGLSRAVPGRPEQPGDIAAPVEMDSDAAASPMPSPSFHGSPQMQQQQQQQQQQPDTIDNRFELYGSHEPEEPPPRSPSIMPTPIGYRRRKEDEG